MLGVSVETCPFQASRDQGGHVPAGSQAPGWSPRAGHQGRHPRSSLVFLQLSFICTLSPGSPELPSSISAGVVFLAALSPWRLAAGLWRVSCAACCPGGRSGRNAAGSVPLSSPSRPPSSCLCASRSARPQRSCGIFLLSGPFEPSGSPGARESFWSSDPMGPKAP